MKVVIGYPQRREVEVLGRRRDGQPSATELCAYCRRLAEVGQRSSGEWGYIAAERVQAGYPWLMVID